MSQYTSFQQHLKVLKYLLRWMLIAFPVAVTIGAVVAFFLWLLHSVTDIRFANAWLLYFLPLAGVSIHIIYKLVGKSSEKGNNLVIDEIHSPGAGIPARMGPIVLLTTIITHLFGGSAGREGTAVQIGGSLSELYSGWFKLNNQDRKALLTAGVAAGFGAVFGTPLTGTVFAMEVLSVGRIKYDALVPCLIASIIGDATVSAIGIEHTKYHIEIFSTGEEWFSAINLVLLAKIFVASVCFGLTALIFSGLAHRLKDFFNRMISIKWLIPILGGLIIVFLTLLLGRPDYLGLGVDPEYAGAVTIQSAFRHGGAEAMSWFWKIVYTTVTLGTGFKGGEVTPLFYIGATLGNTLAELLNAPVSLFAALGFIAVFAGATNTPLACTIMGAELFGAEHLLFFAVACYIAYLFSGDTGIYSSQRVLVNKLPKEV